MITPDYVRLMARYNRWQNSNLFTAADGLDESARQLDRGAFFKSIHKTLSHILLGDTLWMGRFDGWPAPEVFDPTIPFFELSWQNLKDTRRSADARFVDWSVRVTEEDLSGDLTWYSGAIGREISKPRAMLVMQLFNHQTHHRGQVHAMLTAAGARPGDTDLPFMPGLD